MSTRRTKGADFAQISQIPLVKYADPHVHPLPTSFSSPPSLRGVRLSVHAHDMTALSEMDIHSRTAPVAAGGVQPFRSLQPDAMQSSTSLHSNTSRHNHRHGVSRIHILSPFVRIAHRLTRNRRQRAAEMALYKKQLEGPVPEFSPCDPEDNMCAICLCDYEDGNVLRLLPCKHHMHQTCVDEWLHINRSCPLCKQMAIGNEPPAQEDFTVLSNSANPANPEPLSSINANESAQECTPGHPDIAQSITEASADQVPIASTIPVSTTI
ncbi:hypothetical protein BX070DRAFT_234203 [Coemansia spiralis]|nr:hypothetical protein BX070DRAFT_234203 [Coemansia spiralis]